MMAKAWSGWLGVRGLQSRERGRSFSWAPYYAETCVEGEGLRVGGACRYGWQRGRQFSRFACGFTPACGSEVASSTLAVDWPG